MAKKSPLILKLIRERLEVTTFRGHGDACDIRLTFPLSDSDYLCFATDNSIVFLHSKNKYPIIVGTARTLDSFVELIYDFALNVDI